jgi:superfamily II DNA or RNA helicase
MVRKFRFSWDAFDSATVAAIAHKVSSSTAQLENPKAWLEQAVPRPNQDFVRQIKQALEQTWLPVYPGTAAIVKRLMDAGVGPMGNPQTNPEWVQYIRDCRNTYTVQTYLMEAMLQYGDQDIPNSELSPDAGIPRFAILQPSKQLEDLRRPYDYQYAAWNSLTDHLNESYSTGIFQGLLVMPTGSGKTFTAARWLTEQVINRGYRVIWLAHRHELLEQAAQEFHALAGLARKQEKLRIRIVSGIHCAPTQIDPADQIVIASVMSLSRRHDLIQGFLEDPKTFLVIDEAHHAVASSYRALINMLGLKNQKRILGLTATPTRTAVKERGTLSALFGNRILFEIPIKTLIERQFLARPIPVRVATQAKVEQGVTEKDEKYLAQFHNLSDDWLNRIAHIESRNSLIVEHYWKNREKYGKTLIFAIDVPHAALLTERFEAKGVKADYVASYRLGTESVSREEILQRFREAESDEALDVLINVQILTEGVDIPNIQTVFLTRPTVSEILLRQMIGRALRGRKAGGTEDAYIVSFEDHWERFREWQSPLELVTGDPIPPDPDKTVSKIIELLPWDLIREFAARIAGNISGREADIFEAVPHGWYVLSRDQDGEEIYQVISIYEHQQPCWEALIGHLWSLTCRGNLPVSFDKTYDEYFSDCDHPWPSEFDVRKLVEHWRAGGERPEYNVLEERNECDPFQVASKIYTENLTNADQRALVKARYTELAKAIYPSLRGFQAAVDDALFELENPEEANRCIRAIPIFDPGPDVYLTPGPHHDIRRLKEQVKTQALEYLGLTELPSKQFSIDWTRRLVKGWYGTAIYIPGQPQGSGLIRFNRLLDSPDVPEDVIRFLMWHEYLHLYLQQAHTPEFRKLERKWPNYQEADRFLDNLNERFCVQYW